VLVHLRKSSFMFKPVLFL